ncbi:hypothetical protein N9V82_00020 [Candidatus Poseidoniales archaeon]|nr:hypothetical protein [Candidatus Poseidoniales archaeon]
MGISRQCLGNWEHGTTQNPRKNQVEAFWNLYDELIQGSKEAVFARSITKLIGEYGSLWEGVLTLEEEYKKFPEWFVLNRLPWLLYDHFYWPNNRKGNEIQGKRHFGHYRRKEPLFETMIQEAIDQAERL